MYVYKFIKKSVCLLFCYGAVSGLAATNVTGFAETNSICPTTETGSSSSVETNLDSLVKTGLAAPVAETPKPPVPAKRPLRIERAVFLVETESGSGSGFLMEQGEQVYFSSNIHVMSGGKSFSIQNVYGETISVPNVVEVASDRDLVRFPVPSYKRGLEISEDFGFGDDICAVGNSGGGGVITRLDGEILALGPDLVEVSSTIIPGNSGGPVLNENNQIVAVSTYLQNHKHMPDWIIEGTRFEETRRMAVRVDHVKWIPMSWSDFCRETAYVQKIEEYSDEVVRIVESLSEDSYKMIYSEVDHSGLQEWLQRHNKDVRKVGSRLEKVTTGTRVSYKTSSSIERHFRSKIALLADLLDDFERAASRTSRVTIPYFKERLGRYSSYFGRSREQMETVVETMF